MLNARSAAWCIDSPSPPRLFCLSLTDTHSLSPSLGVCSVLQLSSLSTVWSKASIIHPPVSSKTPIIETTTSQIPSSSVVRTHLLWMWFPLESVCVCVRKRLCLKQQGVFSPSCCNCVCRHPYLFSSSPISLPASTVLPLCIYRCIYVYVWVCVCVCTACALARNAYHGAWRVAPSLPHTFSLSLYLSSLTPCRVA